MSESKSDSVKLDVGFLSCTLPMIMPENTAETFIKRYSEWCADNSLNEFYMLEIKDKTHFLRFSQITHITCTWDMTPGIVKALMEKAK